MLFIGGRAVREVDCLVLVISSSGEVNGEVGAMSDLHFALSILVVGAAGVRGPLAPILLFVWLAVMLVPAVRALPASVTLVPVLDVFLAEADFIILIRLG